MSENYNTFIDSHVHYYKRFDVNSFIKNASDNFNKLISTAETSKNIGVLIITETSGEGGFDKLISDLENSDLSKLLVRINENVSFFLEFEKNLSLLFIKGQQIITKENVEVLSLLNLSEIPNGLILSDTIKKVEENNSLPVIAWGFGKWWGSRGKLIKEYLNKNGEKIIFIGDNGGRTSLLKLFPFDHNHKRIIVLAGSDPLNISSGVISPGSYCFKISNEVDLANPAVSLINNIRDFKKSPEILGDLKSFGFFLRNQILLRLNKVL